MKNFILITALAMLTGTIVLIPLNAQAQSTPAQNTAQPDPKETEFITTWYEACSKRDTAEKVEKCCQLSKELIEKYPNAEKKYIDYAKRESEKCTLGKAIQKADTAIKAFYSGPPDATKLDALFTAGDDYLELDKDPQSPLHLYIVAQQALAGQRSVSGGVYKNLDRVKVYAERAIKAFETLNPPAKYQKEYTEYNLYNLRDEVLAYMNQYLGYYLNETRGDQPEAQDQALAYFGKSIQVRSKESKVPLGWNDPFNYYYRSIIYGKQYTELRKKYDPLTDEQKTGDTGKELIKQINELLDNKLIPEDARVIATATKPEYRELKTIATDEFNNLWKFRVDDPTKAPEYLKSFEADPTVQGPPVPAKADDGTGAAAPSVSTGTAKLPPGAAAAPGTGTSKTNATKATGGKTPTKSRTPTKGRRKR